jgi:CubicO group peptidase (beta-lactamase class C family)
MRNITVAWLAFGWSAMAVFAQTNSAALEQIARDEIQKQNIPGLVLVVVRGDRVDFAKGFGLANVETKEPVTADHLFRAGSTTKMMTAAALVSLAEKGKISSARQLATI